jgi:hypothetical protein
MPYASGSDPKLPEYVRALGSNKRKRWVAIFNNVMKQSGSEKKAFAAANAVIKEAKMSKKKNEFTPFQFESDLAEALGGSVVDKSMGVIEGVVLLTGEKVSKNKTFYTKKALAEAVTRYEGAKMFLDHPKPDEGEVRSVRDFGGIYKRVRIEENRLKADLHLVPNTEIRNIVIPIAEAKPSGVGLSIRDRGHGREEGGVFLVEGFSKGNAYSIDLVTEASVNETLYESTQGGQDMDEKEIIASLNLEKLQEGNAALVDAIKSAERQTVVKEFEEKIKAGEEAPKILAQAKKMVALAESGLPKEVTEKLKPVIEKAETSLELTESLIKTQKELIESLKPAPAKTEPVVKGHGASKDEPLSEGELPKPEELAQALIG